MATGKIVPIDGNGIRSAASANTSNIATNTDRLNKFSVTTYTVDNVTTASETSNHITVNVAKSGYTPLGIVRCSSANATTSGVNCSYIDMYRIYLEGSTAVVYFRNYATSQSKVKFIIGVLYKKAE